MKAGGGTFWAHHRGTLHPRTRQACARPDAPAFPSLTGQPGSTPHEDAAQAPPRPTTYRRHHTPNFMLFFPQLKRRETGQPSICLVHPPFITSIICSNLACHTFLCNTQLKPTTPVLPLTSLTLCSFPSFGTHTHTQPGTPPHLDNLPSLSSEVTVCWLLLLDYLLTSVPPSCQLTEESGS